MDIGFTNWLIEQLNEVDIRNVFVPTMIGKMTILSMKHEAEHEVEYSPTYPILISGLDIGP